ncbi:MAG: RNA polymerase sigma factor [Deltaproteobacteria bacterium]|nr:RNA polymerase sigma factor [Deltaproteobacteria bacterium]
MDALIATPLIWASSLRAVRQEPPASDPLVQAARGGDNQALEQLFRRHADEVFRRITRLIGPDPDREDLVQEVFVAAFRGLPKFRGEASFSTWLYRIVVRVAYGHLKRRRARGQQPLSETIVEKIVDSAASPEDKALKQQELNQVLELLDQLKPKKRIAFVLRVVDGLSLPEIGELVNATPATVGQRVRHAQHELQQAAQRQKQQRLREERR